MLMEPSPARVTVPFSRCPPAVTRAVKGPKVPLGPKHGWKLFRTAANIAEMSCEETATIRCSGPGGGVGPGPHPIDRVGPPLLPPPPLVGTHGTTVGGGMVGVTLTNSLTWSSSIAGLKGTAADVGVGSTTICGSPVIASVSWGTEIPPASTPMFSISFA